MSKGMKYGLLMVVSVCLLLVCNLLVGTVSIPPSEVFHILSGGNTENESWNFIVWESRFPQTFTALLCGCALSVCGLMLQTVFRNPLAGPSILGIESGASLGAALVMLLLGGSITAGAFSLSGFLSVLLGAFVGAMGVMFLILFLSMWLKSSLMLLIAGIMVGYVTSSAISLLNFFSTAEGVQSYMIWGMGSFGSVSLSQLPAFALIVALGLLGALLLIKPLNLLLLGDRYAANLGLNVRAVRTILLVVTGLLTAVVTAFCGPVSFIGLAVPHIARFMLGTANHKYLLPFTMLCGGGVTLLCNLLCVLPGGWGVVPLNAVTPFIGAPVIIYVIVSQRKRLSSSEDMM